MIRKLLQELEVSWDESLNYSLGTADKESMVGAQLTFLSSKNSPKKIPGIDGSTYHSIIPLKADSFGYHGFLGRDRRGPWLPLH